MAIEIYETETFDLPDKRVVEIIPINTENMDLLLEFMALAKTADKLKLKETKSRQKTGDITDKEINESIKFTFRKLNPIADKIIDIATQIRDEWEEIPNYEIKDGVEIDGVIYDGIKVPIMEIKNGVAIQQTSKVPKPFPMKYRNIANRIELTKKIIEISMGDITTVADSPLPQKPANKLKE